MATINAFQKYLETLPMKRMGSGCLVFDSDGQVLLVKPTYKLVWEIPGGVVEHNESPKQCCQREIKEELGLDLRIGRLLVVDYSSQMGPKTEALMFIFDVGVLTKPQIASIALKADELSEFGFFTQDSLPADMTTSLKNRIMAAWRQKLAGRAAYLEYQSST
jgi:ADP-ribose pyrophosphatase YjhB (NUDIX family)